VVTLDEFVIDRLIKHYLEIYETKVSIDFPDLNPVLAEYFHDFFPMAILHYCDYGSKLACGTHQN